MAISKSTFEKTLNTKSKWIDNAMKSIGASTQESLKQIYPNLSEVVSTSAKTSKNILSSLKSGKATVGKVADTLKQSKYGAFAAKAYKNALSDLKEGNFNNTDRMFDFGDGNDDFWSDSSGDVSFGDEDEDVSLTNNNYNVQVDSGTRDAVLNLSSNIKKQSENILKTNKASMDAFISVSAAGLYQMEKLGSEITGHLSNINNNLSALVQYQNDNMTKYIEASMAYYDRMGQSGNNTDIYGSDRTTAAGTFNTKNGGINLAQYKNYVNQQIKDSLGMLDLDESMLDMIASNPLGMVTAELTKGLVTKVFGSTIDTVEKTFSNFVPTMLNRLADEGDKYSAGLAGTITKFIGKNFGLRSERKTSIHSAKIEKGAIPFDGETKHAITQVITKELREQTSYLKAIADHYKIDTQKAKADADIFDYNQNKYVKQADLRGGILNDFRNTIMDSFDSSEIGKSLKTLVENESTKENQESLRHTIEEFVMQLTQSQKHVNVADTSSDGELQKILESISYNKGSRKNADHINDALQKLVKNNPSSAYSLTAAILSTQQAATDKLKDYEKNASYYNLQNSGLDNIENIYAELSKEMGYGKENNKKFKGIDKRRKREEFTGESQDFESSGLLSKMLSSGAKHTNGMMTSIMHGNTQEAMTEFTKIFTEQATAIGDTLRDKVISPLKIVLLGTKDANGNSEGGLLSGIRNGMGDILGSIKHNLTGKAWTDSKGNKYEDKDDSVLATLKNMGSTVKAGIMTKLFGPEEVDEDGNPTGKRKGSGIFNSFTESLKGGLDKWKEAFLGESIEGQSSKEVSEKIQKKFSTYTKDATVGGAIGAGVGVMAGGSVLGTLVGGPIGGAAMGIATSILTRSGKLQDWLFGKKDDETGERYGGFLSRGTQDYIKKNKLNIIGGGAVGALTSTLAGKTGGALGTLVGGPIVGAGLGIATTLVTRSDKFKAFLFGDEEKGQIGLVNAIKNGFSKKASRGNNGEEFSLDGKVLGMSGIGILGGVMASAVMPGGPIFGGLMGLGASIAANGESFKKFLFGEDYEEDGKKKHKNGLFGRFGNMLNANVLRPMKTQLSYYLKTVSLDLEYKFGDTITALTESVSEHVGSVFASIRDNIGGICNDIGTGIKENLVDPLVDIVRDNVIEPVADTVKGIAALTFHAVRGAVLAPIRLVRGVLDIAKSKIVETWENSNLKAALDIGKDWLKTQIKRGIRGITKGVLKIVKTALTPLRLLGKGVKGLAGLAGKGVAKLYDGANNLTARINGSQLDSVNTEGMSPSERWRYRKMLETDERNKLRKEHNDQKERDKNAKIIEKATKGQYSSDTAEARAAAIRAKPSLAKKLNTKVETEDQMAKKAKEKIEGRAIALGTTFAQVKQMKDFSTLNAEGKLIWIASKIYAQLTGDKDDTDPRDEKTKDELKKEGDNFSYEEKTNAFKEYQKILENNGGDTEAAMKEVEENGSDVLQWTAKNFNSMKDYKDKETEEKNKNAAILSLGAKFFKKSEKYANLDNEIKDSEKKDNESYDIYLRSMARKKFFELKDKGLLDDYDGFDDFADDFVKNKGQITSSASGKKLDLTDGKHGILSLDNYLSNSEKFNPFTSDVFSFDIGHWRRNKKLTKKKKKRDKLKEKEDKKIEKLAAKKTKKDEKNGESITLVDEDNTEENGGEGVGRTHIRGGSGGGRGLITGAIGAAVHTVGKVVTAPVNLAKSALTKVREKGVKQADKVREKEKEKERSLFTQIRDNTKAQYDETKSHNAIWSKIFSKKGLITVGLLAAVPFVTKAMKWLVSDHFSNTISIVKKVATTVGEGFNALKNGTFGEWAKMTASNIDEKLENSTFGETYKLIKTTVSNVATIASALAPVSATLFNTIDWPSVTNALLSIAEGVGTLVNKIAGVVNSFTENKSTNKDNRSNLDNAVAEVTNDANAIEDLATGHPLEAAETYLTNEDGEVDHATAAKVNFLLHPNAVKATTKTLVKGIPKVAKTTGKVLSKLPFMTTKVAGTTLKVAGTGAEAGVNAASKGLNAIANSNLVTNAKNAFYGTEFGSQVKAAQDWWNTPITDVFGKNTAETVAEEGAEDAAATIAGDAAKEGVEEAAKDTAENVAKETAEETAKDTAETVAKDGVEDAGATIVKDTAKDTAETVAKDGVEDAGATIVKDTAKETAETVAKEGVEDAGATIAKDTAETVAKNGVEDAGATIVKDTAETVAKDTAESTAATLGKDAAKETAETVAKEGAEGASKGGSKIVKQIIEKIKSWIDELLEKVGKKLNKKVGKDSGVKAVEKSVTDGLENMGEEATKKIEKGATEAAAKEAGGAATLGVGTVIMEGGGFLLGAINSSGDGGVARLFQIPQSKVDGKMRIIAAVLGGFTGTTVGSIVDLVNEVVCVGILGFDLLTQIACAIYNIVAKDKDVDKLQDAQIEWKGEYEEYRQGEIEDAYETAVKNGEIDGNEVSLADYIDGVNDGTYTVKYDSFADWNDDQNKTVGAQIADAYDNLIDKGGDLIAAGVDKAKQFGKNVKNTFSSMADKGGDLIAAGVDKAKNAGKKLKNGATKLFNKGKNGLKKLGKGAKNLFNKGKDKVKDTAKKVKNGAKNFIKDPLGSTKKLFNKAKDKVKDTTKKVKNVAKKAAKFLTTKKETAWYDTDGSYYVANGKSFDHYNANGSKIDEDVDADEIQERITAGELEEGTATVKNKIGTIASAIGDKAKNIFSSVKEKASGVFTKLSKLSDTKWGKLASKVASPLTSVIKSLTSKKEKAWYDTDGSYYVANGSGFDHYNATGDLIEENVDSETITEQINSGNLTEGEAVVNSSSLKEGLNNIKDKLSNAWSTGVSKAKDLYKNMKSKVSSVFKSIQENGIIGSIKKLVSSSSQEAWFDANGNYYVKNGKKFDYYNANNDLIEKGIDADEVQEKITTGLLTKGKIQKDSAAKNAVDKIKKSVKESWDKAKSTVSAGWTKFTKWITGGSGDGHTVDDFDTDDYGEPSIMGGSGMGFRRLRSPHGGRGADTVNGFSYYSQNDSDWKNSAYGNDGATMGDTGCGPTAMSMVASQMTGQNVTPTETASLAQMTGDRDSTGTNWNFIDKASAAYGINSTEQFNPSGEYIQSQLEQGKPMILSGASGTGGFGSGDTPYTPAGHYVVATGIDNNGNIDISDPRGKSYSKKFNVDDVASQTGAAWSFGQGGGFGSALESKLGTRLANFDSDAYKSPINQLSEGQCTWYAEGRAYEKCGWEGITDRPRGNGGEIYSKATKDGYDTGTSLKANSLVSLGSSSQYGHVMFVEDVDTDNNKVYYTEANNPANNVVDSDDGKLKVQSIDDWNNKRSIHGYVYCGDSTSSDDSTYDTSTNTVVDSSSDSSSSSSTNSILSGLSSLMGEIGNRFVNGAFTGNYDSDYSSYISSLHNSSSSSSSSTSDTSSTDNSGKKIVMIGDSRTVGMCSAMGGPYIQQTGYIGTKDNVTYIAKEGSGFDWLSETAYNLAKKYVDSNTVVLMWHGVNDVNNADKYAKFVKTEMTKLGAKIYYISVGPCNKNYTSSNSGIEKFNKSLKDALPSDVGWVDVYSYIKDGFTKNEMGTSDGLHYNDTTYKSIMSKIMSTIGASTTVSTGGGSGSGRPSILSRAKSFISNATKGQNGGFGLGRIRRGGGFGSKPLIRGGFGESTDGTIQRTSNGGYTYTSDFFGWPTKYKNSWENSKTQTEVENDITNAEYKHVLNHSTVNDKNQGIYKSPYDKYKAQTITYKATTTADDTTDSGMKHKKQILSKIRKVLKTYDTVKTTDDSSGSDSPAGWIECVQKVKQLFSEQLLAAGYTTDNAYKQENFTFDFGDKGKRGFRRDCTGFVSACLWYYGAVPDDDMPTGGYSSHNFGGSSSSQTLIDDLANAGFTRMTFPGWDKLNQGDILIKHNAHGEIYSSGDSAASHQSWNCGCDEGLLATDTVGGANYAYEEIWRPPNSAATGNSETTTGTATAGGILTGVTSLMGEIGNRLVNGAFTGNYDTDYESYIASLKSSTSSSDSSSDDSSSDGTTTNGTDVQAQVWNALIKKGYSSAATAGIMGNIQQESAFNPAVYSNDGGGGLIQWTPWKTKIGAYSEKLGKGIDGWKNNVSMQMDYLDSTIDAENWAFKQNPSKRWNAPNTTVDEFKKATNPVTAAKQFEAGYERSNMNYTNMPKRTKYAQAFYDTYSSTDSTKMSELVTQYVAEGMDISDAVIAARKKLNGDDGGSGTGRKIISGGRGTGAKISKQRTLAPVQCGPHEGGGGRGDDEQSTTYSTSSSTNADNVVKDYKSSLKASSVTSANQIDSTLIANIISLLKDIANNTLDSSDKLDYLKSIDINGDSVTNNTFVTSNNNNNSKNSTSSSSGSNTLQHTESRNEKLAKRIAAGI